MTLDGVLLQLFNGLSLGSILVMIGLGLAVVFGLMGIINMAHGELMMIGAYSAYVVANLFSAFLPARLFGLYFVAALPTAFAAAALAGAALERGLIRHLYGRPLETLLATWGVSLVLQQLFRQLFGANNVDVASPGWLTGGLALGGVQLPYKRLFILVLAAASLAGLVAYLYRTRLGLMTRAVMQNRAMAMCLGIPSRRIDTITFALGAGLAGLAGCALSLLGSVGPGTGQNYIVDAFMTVVLGGVGTLFGVVAGGAVIGGGSALAEFFTTASMGKVIVFTAVILFLQFRPQGVFTTRTRSLD